LLAQWHTLIGACLQDLAAKGILPKAAPRPAPVHVVVEENPTREIEINDTETKTRYNLTKRTLHDEILRQTGCLVITRYVRNKKF
jgi:hypothetical protein